MKANKLFTISTVTFTSLKEVEDQLKEWDAQGSLKSNTLIFEVTETYIPCRKFVFRKLPTKSTPRKEEYASTKSRR
jgi:hypothetical protein